MHRLGSRQSRLLSIFKLLKFVEMAWGGRPGGAGVDDLVRRLCADDPTLKSLTILKARRFGYEVWPFCTYYNFICK
jgi:hypothetical protein